MTDDQTYLCLLRGILTDRADDLPRLALADYLEENGDPDRAEFIRVQVAVAAAERDRVELLNEGTDWDACTGLSARWCPNCGDCRCRNPEESLGDAGCPLHAPDSRHCCQADVGGRIDDLRRRERELLSAEQDRLRAAWAGPGGGVWWDAWEFRRGFVESVTLSAADWLAHADSLYWHKDQRVTCPACADDDSYCEACDNEGTVARPVPPTAQPITTVVLSTRLPTDERFSRDGFAEYRVRGRGVWVGVDDPALRDAGGMALYLLSREWKGVTFRPPDPAGDDWPDPAPEGGPAVEVL